MLFLLRSQPRYLRYSSGYFMIQLLTPFQNTRLDAVALVLALLQLGSLLICRRHFLPQAFIFFRLRLQILFKVNDFLVEAFLFRSQCLHLRLGCNYLIFQLHEFCVIGCFLLCLPGVVLRQLCQFVPQELLMQAVVNSGFLRMTGERLQLIFDFMDDILHADEIIFRVRQFADRFPFAVAVFSDTGCFFKKGPAFLRTAV